MLPPVGRVLDNDGLGVLCDYPCAQLKPEPVLYFWQIALAKLFSAELDYRSNFAKLKDVLLRGAKVTVDVVEWVHKSLTGTGLHSLSIAVHSWP